ncbi:hypothetical protein GO755_33460 [Spirosoma sp. HMF4905]|uniref:Uncharacterized protein n=1 Tax=Spirosoma arboris TaxID=2682092 RepID=A0A7K1SMG6_9BACT|nr:hypothetical protein [Spirosoma arboris]MVM34984.1 hypothetical protein [Spirosoma arboris]
MLPKIRVPDSVKNALAYRPLQYALLIAGVLLVVYFIGRNSGKGVTVSYPASPTKDPVTDDFVSKQAPNILDALFQAFDGWSLDVDEKTLAVEKILFLTDNQLVYIFNQYNQRYLAGKGQTLYTVIDGEYFGPIGLAAQRKREILKRMRELGMDK